ncbi:Endonuclease YncB, thermonuclease family [Desulfacinum infernum DSM 9756]|uniref:Endonuclease YncB, thermonuclease family n=1 Tax=Desulfacinum infernum DSM 9756 TaxID=1121391 RepID=A0A1M4VQC8_9BACT|nr:thermonuclease family protein [Desulfacinum infernum]SHE71047.1 Endonuclease YncB, thermonuclease family [Desulfacinum infernum DSM 9756]
MRRRHWIGVFLGLWGIGVLFLGVPAWAWTGRVVEVHDGDTLTVLRGSETVKVRLYGVDCPEKSQEGGPEAMAFVVRMVQGRDVSVRPVTRDRYGRTVAWVQADGGLLNEKLVASGHAWVYRRYCKDGDRCRRLLKLEEAARDRALGLWAGMDPVPPWEYRHGAKLASASIASGASTRGSCRCDVDLDCGDFSSWQEAQRCFEECLRVTGRDVHRLDRDGNGRACEGLR